MMRFKVRASQRWRRVPIVVALAIVPCASILLVATLPAISAAEEAAKTGTLEVSITNLDSDKGVLVVAVLNSAEQFSSGDLTFRANENVPIKDGKATVSFEDIPYGTFAVKTFHDENSNGKLDTNFVGYPKEGFGFSNNAMGKFGPPTFEQAKFTFAAEKLRIEIKSK
jgi:uncharacterized protein (DUF2141 family)